MIIIVAVVVLLAEEYIKQITKSNYLFKWKLICNSAAKKSTFSTLFFAGLYGVLLIGILSDK